MAPSGSVTAPSFAVPHLDNRIELQIGTLVTTEVHGDDTSYGYQLRAVTSALEGGTPFPVDAHDAVATMRLVDACYRAAGLAPRGRSSEANVG